MKTSAGFLLRPHPREAVQKLLAVANDRGGVDEYHIGRGMGEGDVDVQHGKVNRQANGMN